jgi:hypothetical protein
LFFFKPAPHHASEGHIFIFPGSLQ